MMLYVTYGKKRYFLIPPTAKLPQGPFMIVDMAGVPVAVSEQAILPYEKTKQEAKTHLLKQAEAATKIAQQRLEEFQKIETESNPGGESNQEAQSITHLIYLMMGITPEQLKDNPEATKEGIQDVFQGIKTFLEKADLKEHPPREIKKQIEQWEIDLDLNIEDLIQAAKPMAAQMEGIEIPEALQSQVKDLLGGYLNQLDQTDGAVDKFYQQMDKIYHNLYGDIEKQKKADQQKRIRKSIKSSIAENLKARGFTPLTTDEE